MKKIISLCVIIMIITSLAACSNTDDSGDNKTKSTTSLPPGKDYVAQQGEEFKYDNGRFTVTLNNVYSLKQSTDDNPSNRTLLALEMTTTNNSGDERTLSGLENFKSTVNGKEVSNPLSVMGMVNFNHYFDSDKILSQTTIKDGETKTFIMPTEVADNFSIMTISFKPYVYFSNDTVTFTVKKENCIALPDNPEDWTGVSG
jgi:hypothetical protein